MQRLENEDLNSFFKRIK